MVSLPVQRLNFLYLLDLRMGILFMFRIIPMIRSQSLGKLVLIFYRISAAHLLEPYVQIHFHFMDEI